MRALPSLHTLYDIIPLLRCIYMPSPLGPPKAITATVKATRGHPNGIPWKTTGLCHDSIRCEAIMHVRYGLKTKQVHEINRLQHHDMQALHAPGLCCSALPFTCMHADRPWH